MTFKYRAKIIRILDGDTIQADLDLGMNIHSIQILRLARIDAPEKRGEEREQGLLSETFLDDWLTMLKRTDSMVEIHTTKKGKYGRYIAEVLFRLNPETEFENLSDWMVINGFAEFKDY